MGRKKTGSIIRHSGGLSVQITVDGKRATVAMPQGTTETVARLKASYLSEAFDMLASSPSSLRGEVQSLILESANESTMRRVIERLRKMIAERTANTPTIQSIGEQWTSGELAEK